MATTKYLYIHCEGDEVIVKGIPQSARKRFIKALCTFCEDGMVTDENEEEGYAEIEYTT